MNPEFIAQIKAWQTVGQKIVLVTGVFDLLHVEHIRFLTKAKALGDKLVVGIESDKRVREVKGYERPVNNEMVRQEQLTGLKAIDLAFILPEQFNRSEDWELLMSTIKPQIYAVSSHTSFQESKQRVSEKYGAKFEIVHQFNPEYSSSKILQKLQEELE
jgi:rfaE bifunctional protein nucleotidyltransferase chain/domain